MVDFCRPGTIYSAFLSHSLITWYMAWKFAMVYQKFAMAYWKFEIWKVHVVPYLVVLFLSSPYFWCKNQNSNTTSNLIKIPHVIKDNIPNKKSLYFFRHIRGMERVWTGQRRCQIWNRRIFRSQVFMSWRIVTNYMNSTPHRSVIYKWLNIVFLFIYVFIVR